jgi:hypothetical protein
MGNPWTKDEERKLLNAISQGQTFDNISKIHNRSPNALELRLKKIIYDNIIKSSDASQMIQKLASILKLPQDKVNQFYYEYKGFIEKKQPEHKTIQIDQNLSNQSAGAPAPTINLSINSVEKKNKSIDIDEKNRKIDILQKENKLMRDILDNIKMKNKIKKLIKDGKLNKKIKSKIFNLSH